MDGGSGARRERSERDGICLIHLVHFRGVDLRRGLGLGLGHLGTRGWYKGERHDDQPHGVLETASPPHCCDEDTDTDSRLFPLVLTFSHIKLGYKDLGSVPDRTRFGPVSMTAS